MREGLDWDMMPQTRGSTMPLGLVGRTGAQDTLEKEQPWHRIAAYLLASGCRPDEVAAAFDGVSVEMVRRAIRTPWFQAHVTTIMNDRGGADVMELFKGAAFDAYATLHELCTNVNVAASVRKASAAEILDRAYGKPTQRIESVGQVAPSSDPVAECRRLEEAIKRGREELL